MTETISREDCIAWLECFVNNESYGDRVYLGHANKDRLRAILSYLRPPPADDGVIGVVAAWAGELIIARNHSFNTGDQGSAIIERDHAADLSTILALARQAGATGEHPVSVVVPCPEGWPDDAAVERAVHRLWEIGFEYRPAGVHSDDWLKGCIRLALKAAAPPPPVQLSLRVEVERLKGALKRIANGREVSRGDHTEIIDREDAAEIALAALQENPNGDS